MATDARSRKGIFLIMQYPMEIDGVSNQDLKGKKIGVKDLPPYRTRNS